MNRIEKNDASALCEMSRIYYSGLPGVQQDRVKAMELLKKAAELGSSESHFSLGSLYNQGGDLKKAKFHYKAAALVGARFHLGIMEGQSQNPERAVQHFKIAASAGEYNSMQVLLRAFNEGFVRRDNRCNFDSLQ
jgi:TPR repeat protein